MTYSADPDSWLLQKPADLDLHCLQRQGISGFSRTRVNILPKTKRQLQRNCFLYGNLSVMCQKTLQNNTQNLITLQSVQVAEQVALLALDHGMGSWVRMLLEVIKLIHLIAQTSPWCRNFQT